MLSTGCVPSVDLFATKLSKVIPYYVSQFLEEQDVLLMVAFSQCWDFKIAWRGRPRKTESRPPKDRRTKNTGGVHVEDINLDEYVTVVKLTNAAFQCNLCFKGFIDANAWKHHVGKHDPSAGDIECPVCKFRFPTKRALQKHATNHEKKYACKSCPYHPSSFICSVCGYSFVSQLGLTMHKTMMHKDVSETAKAESSEESGPYCQECDVKFVSMEAYKRHMVTSCSEEIPNAREYWTHFRRVHPDKNYPIQKNYVCDVCGKSFRYKCGQCGKSFYNRTNLTMHARTHSDSRPYPCNVCFKAFKCKGALDRHYRSHTGVKPYECEVCGKTFGQSNSRKLHVRTVHLKQPAPYVSRTRVDKRKLHKEQTHIFLYPS
ncbi:Uncharacterized protein OBRU01_19811 [Operophtera brumata]|uniref:C2H2-type domain-containing protein n=1 Tax=Operophtera brumata TaxID=104452 RepID=A0A0L7KW31_OPEBR|nr:Uncharacterized protein OBRU01_19811 [Operophtera brumata]